MTKQLTVQHFRSDLVIVFDCLMFHSVIIICLSNFNIFFLQFDFGPSLLDEMDAAFQNYKAPPRPGSPNQHSPPANDEVINRRNEIQEAAAKSKKKLATVCFKTTNQ